MINKNDLFPIGIGTWGVGGFVERDTSVDEARQVKAIAHMINSEMNFVEANYWYSQGYSVEILAKAIEKSDKKRDDIFVCQAVYLKDYGLDRAEEEVDKVLKLLKTDYVDTIQFSQSVFLKYKLEELAEFVEKMMSKSKTRFAGITNENLDLLKDYHNIFKDKLISHEVVFNFEVRENEKQGIIPYAEKNDILTVVYQPLRRNRTAQRKWPLVVELSKKYGITQNQLLMAWIVGKGFLPLTKSETIEHIDEHIASLKINLEKEDAKKLDEFVIPGYKPPAIDWDKSGEGVRIDQISNIFDEEYGKQMK